MHRGAISRSSQAPNFVVPLTGLSECYKVEEPGTALDNPEGDLVSDGDVDNPALRCPDIPPAIAEPPPAPCPPGIDVSAKLLPALDPCLDGVTVSGACPSDVDMATCVPSGAPRRSRRAPQYLEDFEVYQLSDALFCLQILLVALVF